MEVNFKRTYIARNRRYALGEIAAMHGYAMEIMQPHPHLSAGKLQPGEMMMILFGVTPEEYEWQKTDPKRLDKLADSIRRACPADRLIGFAVRDLKGASVTRDVQLETAPSIDKNGFPRPSSPVRSGTIDSELYACAQLQKHGKDAPEIPEQDCRNACKTAAQAILRLDSFFAAYDMLMNGRYPAQSFDGKIELFTSAERAENAHRQITQAFGVDIWQIHEIPRAEYSRFFDTCRCIGVEQARIDNGFSSAELRIEDFADGKPVQDAHIFNLMLREIQYGLRWNRMKQENAPERAVRGALESTLTMQNFARREIGNAVLYIICPGVGGKECTAAAHGRIGAGRIVHVDSCIQIADKRDMQNFLAAFTNQTRAMAFANRMNPPAHAVAAVFDDAMHLAKSCEGIILNPDALAYRVRRTDFDKVLELRAKPPIAVRVQPEAESANENTQSASATPIMNAPLPDPDVLMPKRDSETIRTAEYPHTAEAARNLETAKPKEGLFKRLFGKSRG